MRKKTLHLILLLLSFIYLFPTNAVAALEKNITIDGNERLYRGHSYLWPLISRIVYESCTKIFIDICFFCDILLYINMYFRVDMF